MDAGYGTALLSNAQHQFTYLSPAQSSLFVNGQTKDIIQINTAKGKQLIVVAMNDAPVKVFEKKK